MKILLAFESYRARYVLVNLPRSSLPEKASLAVLNRLAAGSPATPRRSPLTTCTAQHERHDARRARRRAGAFKHAQLAPQP